MLKKCKVYVERVKYIPRGMKGAGTYYTVEKSVMCRNNSGVVRSPGCISAFVPDIRYQIKLLIPRGNYFIFKFSPR